MDLRTVTFLTSAADPGGWPRRFLRRGVPLPEVAIVGRSNAGKSSLINHLFQKHQLAKSSSTPGKTQLMNFFLCHPLLFVDLPGYGYAAVPPALQKKWEALIRSYCEERNALSLLLLLSDVRRPISSDEIDWLSWAASRGCPAILLLTKADKAGKSEAQRAVAAAKKLLPAVECLLYSTKEGDCRKALIQRLQRHLEAIDSTIDAEGEELF